MSEKRLHKRIRKSVKCEVYSDGLTFSSTIDMGHGGIFISTPEPLIENSEIEIILYVPENEPMELKARVKWIRDEESDDEKVGMGVEFIDISDEKQAIIDRFVE